MSELINGTDCPRCLYRVRVDKVCKNRSSVTCPRCRKLKTCTDPCISMKSFQNIKEPEEIL